MHKKHFINVNFVLFLHFRHQTLTYTQQLVKDTHILLTDLVTHDNRHLKIQKDRLADEFTAAITAFQAIQRKYVDIEKNFVREQRGHNIKIPKPPGSQSKNNNNNSSSSLFEDNFAEQTDPKSQQIQMQEDIDLQAIEEQERNIRKLEVNYKLYLTGVS